MENKYPKQPSKLLLFPIIIFMIFICLPEIITIATTPDDMVFNGTFVNIDDMSVYLSAIRQGSEGKWMFTSQFTPEPQQPILAYIPFLMTGKLQNIVGGSTLLWYQSLRVASLLFALYGISKLASGIFPHQPQIHLSALWILLFGSGISWLLMASVDDIPAFSADFRTPELNLASSTLSAPHFLIGIGCQALILYAVMNILTKPRIFDLAKLFIFLSLLTLSYPFLIPVDGLIFVALLSFQGIKQRGIPWKKLGYLVSGSLPMIFFLFYYGIVLTNNSSLASTLVENNQIEPPNLLGLISGYGLILFFALYGTRSLGNQVNQNLLLIWIILNLLCLYLPVSFSGRFVLGLFIPLSLVAALGIEKIVKIRLNWKSSKMLKSPDSLRKILVILTVPSTFLLLFWTVSSAQSNPNYPYYLPKREVIALKWLADHTTEEDLIFADYPISNFIPRYSPARVFLGHLNLTINLKEKISLQQKFWDSTTDPAWRSKLIEDWGITYLYVGKFEIAHYDQSFPLPGELVYDQNGITIFKLIP